MISVETALWVFTLLIHDTAHSSKVSDRPLIKTPLGAVRGHWKQSFEGRSYASFEGIPYAQPPIGNLRFEEPRPIEPWVGIWEASRLYRCAQSQNGDEDCLYINVYVPETSKKDNLDIVAHIHGGGFLSGAANDFLDPKYVMDTDAILVTFNYRLGIFGFLSTEDKVVPGNNGMKDQVLALKWIRDNIASFGGNPQSVTLNGFSAGGAAVHLHYFSPMSAGLFKRGFSLSGTAINSLALQRNASSKAKTVAEVVGCGASASTRTMVECLKTRPAHLLVDAMPHLQPLPDMPICLFTPVVEVDSANPFLTERPYEMLRNGKVLDVPWMTSVTANDGMLILLLAERNFENINTRWEDVADIMADYYELIPKSQYLDAARRIRDLYFPIGKPISEENLYNVEKMFTDWYFALPAEEAVIMQSKVTKSPVYYFRLSYVGQNSYKYNLGSTISEDIVGTCHGDDMIYFFGGLITKDLSENEIKLKKSCMDMLYSYANRGHPVFGTTELKAINSDDELFFYNISGPQDIRRQIKSQNAAKLLWADIMNLSNIYSTKEEL